jgi:hypothetical protein
MLDLKTLSITTPLPRVLGIFYAKPNEITPVLHHDITIVASGGGLKHTANTLSSTYLKRKDLYQNVLVGVHYYKIRLSHKPQGRAGIRLKRPIYRNELTSFFPTATTSFSATLTPPVVSTYANGASPITLRYTSPTVEPLATYHQYISTHKNDNETHFFTRTQSLNTELLPAEPEVKVFTLRTGKIGTRPRSSAARESTCTTPVLPKR